MRDLSGEPALLSINGATVRKQADLLGIIEACARHRIAAISPWRDQVAAVGLARAVTAIKDAGLKLSGYCRGGLFPADASQRTEARDDNRRAVDEAAALGAPCLILVAGGLPVLEITLRTAAALDCIKAIIRDVGGDEKFTEWSIEIFFYFDDNGKLLDYNVKRIGTSF